MRERAFATFVVWAASIFGIDRLLASVRYETWVPNPNLDPNNIETLRGFQGYYQTTWASGGWQLAVLILVGLVLLCAVGATIAMWTNARESERAEREARDAAKQKRLDPQREARVRRLLANLDDDELEALEQNELGDDGERVSMDALLKRR